MIVILFLNVKYVYQFVNAEKQGFYTGPCGY